MKSLSVRPFILCVHNRNFDPAPAEADVGVMALLLGKLTHLVDEAQSLPEVVEPEGPSQMVLLGDLPFGDLLPERVELLPLEGRNTALAQYARLTRQFGHSVPPEKMNLLRKDLMCRNFSLPSFGLLVSSRQYHISSTPKY